MRDKFDLSGFKGIESNVGEEFGDGRGIKVDGLLVFMGFVDINEVNGFFFLKFVINW